MKKRILSIIAIAVLVVILASLFVGCKKDEDKDALAICLASEPASLDPALNSAVDGATMLIHLFAGLVKYDKDGKLVADAAESLPTPVENTDGTVTYTFTLREGMKWSNGDALLASDFEWAWKRAAAINFGADYGYMFEVIKGYGMECDKDSSGNPIYYEVYTKADEEADETHEAGTFKLDSAGNKIVGTEDNGDLYYPADVTTATDLAVVANDTARTLAVTLTVDVPYFYELCAFPAYFPVYNREGHAIDADGKWATDPATYICNGPYTMKAWSHNEYITLVKNDNYYDAASITMPKIRFYLSDNEATMLTNFKTGEWVFVDDVPTDEIPALKRDYASEFNVGSQLGTYYISFNNNNDLLPAGWTGTAEERSKANAQVRKALSLLIDRDYICEEIGQAGQVPAASFVALGLTDPSSATGKQFYQEAGNSSEYIGYYNATKAANESNKAAAVAILDTIYTKGADGKYNNFPTFTYLYNTSAGHQAIGEYIQGAFAAYGINMELKNQEWATFLDTRKAGNYGVARNGWLGDYNDPISFLDMWTTQSGNNDVQYGKYSSAMTITTKYDASALAIYSMDLSGIDGYADKSVTNGTWANTYDKLIEYIKKETNTVKRYQLMHKAEDLLMETGCICPLYYYTDIYMCSTKLSGFFASPLGYKYFMYTTLAA